MMKRRFQAVMVLALFSFSCVLAQKVTIDKITYKISDGEACVYEADKDIEVANILNSVEYKGKTYPVTSVGRNGGLLSGGRAFWNCGKLTSVSIPSSVKTIGTNAFYGCSSLEELSIPNSVKYLGMWSMSNRQLKRLIVPDYAIEVINKYYPAFADCTGLTEIKCQNGSFPLWILPYLPKDCPFMLAQQYQQAGNNNMFAQNAQQAPIQQQTMPQPLAVQEQPVAVQEQTKAPSSDVDVDIPQGTGNNKNTFAIIIANEDYQGETKVDYAKNDGEVFKNYCHKTFGLPEKNVHFVANATLNNLIGELDWLQQVCDAFGGDANVIFYYAGHGIPDEASGSAYLLPTDGNSRLLRTCFSINELYETLGKLPAKKVTVLMDACFSGAKRNGEMLASARGVAIKAKADAPKGNMIVLSASQGDETAYKYEEAGHGLFTYFLLKKLKESRGNVTMGELSQYVQEQVKRTSIVENGKSQTPSVQTSDKLRDNWKSLRLE